MKHKIKSLVSDIIKHPNFPANSASINNLSIFISVLIATLSLRTQLNGKDINSSYHNYFSDFKFEFKLIKQRFPELIII